jgi:hypothetical protein
MNKNINHKQFTFKKPNLENLWLLLWKIDNGNSEIIIMLIINSIIIYMIYFLIISE